MKKIADFIVNKRKIFLIVFFILAVGGAVAAIFVKVNYDMSVYLPKGSDTVSAMEIMNEEFGDNGAMTAMTSVSSIDDALDVKRQLKEITGSENGAGVLWLDDALLAGKDAMGGMLPPNLAFLADYFIPEDDAEFLNMVFDMLNGSDSLSELITFLNSLTPEMIAMLPSFTPEMLPYLPPELQQLLGSLPPETLALLPYLTPDIIESLPSVITGFKQTLEGTASGFLKDGKALYQVTFSGTAYDKATVDAIKKIKELRTVNVGGPSATSYAMQSAIVKQLILAAAIIVPFLLLILFCATKSWFDPLTILAVLIVSVLLGMGTNLILGTISYLTNSVAILLQIAISMDYSIFFLHAFQGERKKGLMPADATKTALKKSFTSITACAITTIASFVAMLFMRYSIGFDLGIVLGKSILLSLLTVFLFMPAFAVMTSKVRDKWEHRSFFSLFKKRGQNAGTATTNVTGGLPASAEAIHDDINPVPLYAVSVPKDTAADETALEPADTQKPEKTETAQLPPTEQSAAKTKPPIKERIAGGIIKARFVVPILLLLLIVPAFFGQANNNFMYGELASAGGKGSILQNDREAIEQTFGSQNNAVILLHKDYWDKEAELAANLSEIRLEEDGKNYLLGTVQSRLFVPPSMQNRFIGKNKEYSRIILAIDTEEESDTAFAVADKIRAIVATVLPDGGYHLLGSTISTQELVGINKHDYNLVTILTIAFLMVILLFTFRGLTLPVILGVTIQAAIWIGMSIPFLFGEPIVFLGYLIVSCVQMGATIDYGILLSSHYQDNRRTMDKIEAGKKAFLSSIGPVTMSAAILAMVGFAVAISGMTAATSVLGMLLGRGTIISYILMMFVLPPSLVLLDKPIQWTTIKRRKKNAGSAPKKKG